MGLPFCLGPSSFSRLLVFRLCFTGAHRLQHSRPDAEPRNGPLRLGWGLHPLADGADGVGAAEAGREEGEGGFGCDYARHGTEGTGDLIFAFFLSIPWFLPQPLPMRAGACCSLAWDG